MINMQKENGRTHMQAVADTQQTGMFMMSDNLKNRF